MIALFHLNYWCDSDEEKNKLKTLFKINEEKYQAEIREKYNPNNLFKKIDSKQKENIEAKEVSMTEYKESFFKKIMNKIKSILHIR